MKIWLHFTRAMQEYRLEGNAYEVCDVVLSTCNEPETLQIFKEAGLDLERYKNKEVKVTRYLLKEKQRKGENASIFDGNNMTNVQVSPTGSDEQLIVFNGTTFGM